MKKAQIIKYKDEKFPISITPNCISGAMHIIDASTAMHEAIEIKYFYEGESTLLVGSKTVKAKAGDVVVINPYEFHTTLDCGNIVCGKYCRIMMDLDFLKFPSSGIDLRSFFFTKRKRFKNHYESNLELAGILSRIVDEKRRDDEASHLAIIGLMAEFFAYLLRSGVKQTDAVVKDGDSLKQYAIIEPALRKIRDNYSEKIKIEELANVCNISKYHFCRVFKAVMGMSCVKYLNIYRLKIADALLSGTDKQICEIASVCGFDDTSYFSRIYKKHFGLSPREKTSGIKNGKEN